MYSLWAIMVKESEKKTITKKNTFITVAVFILVVFSRYYHKTRLIIHHPTQVAVCVRKGRPEAEPAVYRRKELFVNIIYTRPKRDTRSQKYDKSWLRALIPVVAPSFNWTRNIYYHFMRFASKNHAIGREW